MLDPRIYRTWTDRGRGGGDRVRVLAHRPAGCRRHQPSARRVQRRERLRDDEVARRATIPTGSPGSSADYDVAGRLSARACGKNGFSVTTQLPRRTRSTARGTLRTVTAIGTRPGSVEREHRGRRPPRFAAARPRRRSVGDGGAARARPCALRRDAASLAWCSPRRADPPARPGDSSWLSSSAEPVDAVIVLGDLAGSEVRQPAGCAVVERAAGRADDAAQHRDRGRGLSVAGRARRGPTSLASDSSLTLRFPLTIDRAGAVRRRRYPAVLVSLPGEHAPDRNQPVGGPARITELGPDDAAGR